MSVGIVAGSRDARMAQKEVDVVQENARLRAELRHAEEERDTLNKAAAYSARGGAKCTFKHVHSRLFRLVTMYCALRG